MKKAKRQLQVNPKPPGEGKRRKVADPDRAESVAEAFEEVRGKFPRPVSDQRGKDAFGCDLLSFGSEADRLRFESTGDTELIERYIEVKGSTRETGIIVLVGNELKSANEHRDKYFLYRVYEGEEHGKFEVVTLQDPMSTNFEVSYNIDPFRSGQSKFWAVKEVDEDQQNEK